jgi:hypothetical protein
LCWLNTDSEHVCQIAILGQSDSLPWGAARRLFEHQRDFNYLEARHLWEDAEVSADGIRIAGMLYRVLIVEDEPPERAGPALKVLEGAGRLSYWDPQVETKKWLNAVDQIAPPDVRVSPPAVGLRVRHVVKGGMHYYLLFNEAGGSLEVKLDLSATGEGALLDPLTGARRPWNSGRRLRLDRHQCRVLAVGPD